MKAADFRVGHRGGDCLVRGEVGVLAGTRGQVEPPTETIDTVGVKSDLLAIAQAERMYMASHGSYVSLDDLEKDGSLSFSGTSRRGYTYTCGSGRWPTFQNYGYALGPRQSPVADPFH